MTPSVADLDPTAQFFELDDDGWVERFACPDAVFQCDRGVGSIVFLRGRSDERAIDGRRAAESRDGAFVQEGEDGEGGERTGGGGLDNERSAVVEGSEG